MGIYRVFDVFKIVILLYDVCVFNVLLKVVFVGLKKICKEIFNSYCYIIFILIKVINGICMIFKYEFFYIL